MTLDTFDDSADSDDLDDWDAFDDFAEFDPFDHHYDYDYKCYVDPIWPRGAHLPPPRAKGHTHKKSMGGNSDRAKMGLTLKIFART